MVNWSLKVRNLYHTFFSPFSSFTLIHFFSVACYGVDLWRQYLHSWETERSKIFSGYFSTLQFESFLSCCTLIIQHLYVIPQIHIHIEVPAEFTVTAKLYSLGDCNGKSGSSDEFSYSFEVQYLPPIVLTCLLPKSYPSHLPPYFTISVQWLDSTSISHLCSMLDSIWTEQPGLEVIYQWADWLQNYSLSFLGIDKDIILGPCVTKHKKDRRAISGSVSLEVDVPSLRSYNAEQCHENFCKNLHECCICCDEYAGNFQSFPKFTLIWS